MKSCPTCNRTYTDASLNFCLEDGTPLTMSAPATPGFDPNATIRYTDARETKPPQQPTPPPSVPPGSQPSRQPPHQQSYPASYQPMPPVPSTGSAFGQQQYARPVMTPPRRKSNAVWWILGVFLVLGVIAIGAVIMILALANMNSNENGNANRANTNTRNVNRNTNANANTNTNTNTNVNASLPALLADDFSQPKWTTDESDFGEMWYADEQYHMRAKEKSFLVMYAPAEYNTANATVSVTARSVDGTPPSTGYGLIIHGEKKAGKLEDYALLIYSGDDPKYEIIKHKDDDQKVLVPWTKSSVIRTGTNPNRLEIRARNTDISFYINGQYVDRITDSENFKGGVAGLYTSDVVEVAFDDLEIKR